MAAVTNVRTIKRRIRSVQNTAKITKAMQMISASKMRRAQQASLAGRPYADKMRSVLADLAAQASDVETDHPLLRKREVNRIQIIHITPDRGLCGGLVSNLTRSAGQFISGVMCMIWIRSTWSNPSKGVETCRWRTKPSITSRTSRW